MKTRTFLRTLLAAASTAALLAHAPLALAGGPTTLKVGVTAGPHAEIIEQVKKQAGGGIVFGIVFLFGMYAACILLLQMRYPPHIPVLLPASA